MSVIARHLMIMGRVQGVFFRNWTIDTAQKLGLAGWVRNRTDGSVEAWVEGPVELVEQFVALVHDGPPAAKVARIDSEDVVVEGLRTFEKKPTC